MTQTGAEYDHNAGITTLLHRHNLETAYGHNLIGNNLLRLNISLAMRP